MYVDEKSKSEIFEIEGVKISYTPILKVYSKRAHSIQIMGSIDNLLDKKIIVPVSLMQIARSKDDFIEQTNVFCYDNKRKSFSGDSVQNYIEMTSNSKIYFNCNFYSHNRTRRFWSIQKYIEYLTSEPIVLCWKDFVSQGESNYCDTLFYKRKSNSSSDALEFDSFPSECGY